MNGDQYLNIISKKYSGIERSFYEGNFKSDYGIYDPIKISLYSPPKQRFKNTIRKTNKFFRKVRMVFGIKSKIK